MSAEHKLILPFEKDNLGYYLDDLGHLPSELSDWAKLQDAKKWQKSTDPKIKLQGQENFLSERNRLVEANLKLVPKMAKRYTSGLVPMEDLIQEGNLKLIRAVEKFDPQRDVKFSHYAGYWIKSGFITALTSEGRALRLPAKKIAAAREIYQIKEDLLEKGESPSEEKIAQVLGNGISGDQIREILQASQYRISLETLIELEDSSRPLKDFVSAASEDGSPEEVVLARILKDEVADLLDMLSENHRPILERRFGFLGKEQTLEEIGAEFGRTREAIRQREERAKKIVRVEASARHLQELLV